MKYLSCLALLALISCGSSEVRKDIESTSYRTSGVEQFFLPGLPNWAHFSGAGNCFKTNTIQYLDFGKIRDAYQLSYAQMSELQAQYNERLENYFRSTAVRFLKPIEEASFFANTMEQVRGGVRSLKIPAVAEVEIVWLESFTPAELKKLARTGRFDEKLSILYSSCHTKQTLTQWIAQEELEDVGFYILSSEWLNPYNTQGQLRPGLKIEIGELLGKQLKYSFVTGQNKQLTEIILP